ncbi:unnamed protein product [Leptosia nina]|uniref:Transcriptional regulator ATRX homolog n=1 Tax=Leptosia nina TaxID=320188 RepID=A0AAV1J5F8_9NEOP
MAASAPINDVLCGAVEYLVKLGCNLRQRSETLKNKRINKDRLRNSHAVQKGAKKVLLLCELSKKSIHTVESSVEAILSQISNLQANTNASEELKELTHYESFMFNSKRLRIRKKIDIKQYTSANVVVTRMPITALDKYPVHYDCKLLRLRMKVKKTNDRDCDTSHLHSSSYGKREKSVSFNENIVICENTKKDDAGLSNSKTVFPKCSENPVEEAQRIKNMNKANCNSSVMGHVKKNNEDESTILKESLLSFEESRNQNYLFSSKKEISTLSLTSNDVNQSESINLSSHKSDKNKLSVSNENSDTNDKVNDKINLCSHRKEDSTRILTSNNDKIQSDTTLHSNGNLCTANELKSYVPHNVDEDNFLENNTHTTENCESDRSLDSNSSKKTFIKCVNIKKLLRPDVIPKALPPVVIDSDSDSNRSKIKYQTKRQQMQKKVESFKPKNFTIIVTKLPELNIAFLKSHNLKKIIQKGKIICEVLEFPKNSPELQTDNPGKAIRSISSRQDNSPKNIDSIKKSLVNASDSENTGEDIRQVKSENVKRSLCESHSDKDKTTEKKMLNRTAPDPIEKPYNQNFIDNSKHSDVCNSGINTKITNIECNNDCVNSGSVLTPEISNETTRSNAESLFDSLKSQKQIDSPPSKRKRIMESIHAKRMLLAFSSSSDTEDEQLRSTAKQIQNELLKVDMRSPNNKEKCYLSDSDKSTTSSKSSNNSIKKNTNKKRRNSAASSGESETDYTKSSTKKMEESNGKSSSGSQHLSSRESDKEIEGLTNIKTLRKSARQRSQHRNRWREFRMARMPKAPLISEEVVLQAECESDVASVASNDDCDVDELPRLPLTTLNGDVEAVAKEDLLGDSDSSTSHNQNKNSQDDEEINSEGENLKSKRRKANAISSDSEAGSSRKKDPKVSDFEDSEDDGLEPVKKSKRRKKESDSDASVGSSDEHKKKRRRIKNIDDSEGSGSETENEGRNKHGRKNIRKVMGKSQLEEATKKAAREEKERMARIAERQKLYNNLQFDESGKPDEVVLDKVVLDFDPETKDPIIEVDKGLVKKLKPHQANGIKFMWDACFESVKRIKKGKGSGCILAHCMGLGKTLQVVSLTHTLLTHSDLTSVNRVLVVCPLSTVLNWVNEFKMWLKHAETDYDVEVYELSRFKQNSDRAYQLSQWYQHGGVCVLGYEMFRNLSSDSNKKFKKKMLKNFQESLVDPGPDLVVCDEGHLLKNEKTSLSQAMNKVKTLRRIVLTGTPLQNNLKEYYCMVQFVKPNLLGKYNEYLNRFVNPITNGQYTDSTEHDIKIMKRRSHVLHKMLDGAVQRRDYGVLAPFLPPKHEYVLFITLTEVQIKLYTHYLENYSRRPLPGKSSGFLFPDFQSLQRIWTHPLVLKYNSERYEIMQQKKREREEEEEDDSGGSLVDFIDDSSTEESTTEESTDDMSDISDDSRKKSKKKKSPKKSKKRATRRGTRANPVEAEDDDVQEVEEVRNENPTEWWMSLVNEEELDDMRNSHKLILLFDILRQCEAIGDKLLVFSQSLYSLDLIEHFLGKVDEATQEARVDEKLGGHVGSWSPGIDYFRLDGSTSCENRSIWCKNFNREDNPRARLFLISTRAGGLGINLVAANRVVIFDVSWNPSHDVQSIFRVYRFGQKKPCYIYRFLVMGTMEEKIYERQVTKQAISKRVIDEQQIDRHYAENDLAELYKFEPKPPQPRPIPPLPKDRLFAEMLKEHEQLIYKYHEHDSLLENKEEETLTEEERKAAWEDFENEKTRPPPVPFASPYAMHNGMMLAQQQQLAFQAMAAMLRKEAPNISENQVRDMIPLLYGANPQLIQKMTEMYKYPQAGMMNAGMMNAVMNPGGGGMPMGGTSGMQYEPPWQRQQQMRLQQLIQQQNQMGAKYYAGGLGSRDPVAMALQHQRAREMMLGERSRPRGRPPNQTPRPAPQDVVNLDSD